MNMSCCTSKLYKMASSVPNCNAMYVQKFYILILVNRVSRWFESNNNIVLWIVLPQISHIKSQYARISCRQKIISMYLIHSIFSARLLEPKQSGICDMNSSTDKYCTFEIKDKNTVQERFNTAKTMVDSQKNRIDILNIIETSRKWSRWHHFIFSSLEFHHRWFRIFEFKYLV